MMINCPNCGQEMIEDVIEDIEVTDCGIYFDANEVYKCDQCGHVDYQKYDAENE